MKKGCLTLLGNFINYVEVELLETKSETTLYIKDYINEGEAFQNLKVSKIRWYSGGEYYIENNEMFQRNFGERTHHKMPSNLW